MPNLIWPRALSPQISHAGLIGRGLHWLGVALAGALVITAIGFAADGWSRTEAAELALGAVVLAMTARGARYLLAHE
jgi:hypothetical protein